MDGIDNWWGGRTKAMPIIPFLLFFKLINYFVKLKRKQRRTQIIVWVLPPSWGSGWRMKGVAMVENEWRQWLEDERHSDGWRMNSNSGRRMNGISSWGRMMAVGMGRFQAMVAGIPNREREIREYRRGEEVEKQPFSAFWIYQRVLAENGQNGFLLFWVLCVKFFCVLKNAFLKIDM